MQPTQASNHKLSVLLLAAGVAFGITSCGHGHRHGSVGSGGSNPQVFDEIEPNDDPLFGDFIGYVDSLSHLIVEGSVDDDPGPLGDIYDHFEFVTDEPASFEVRLESFHTWNDVALGVFDPDSGEMVMWVDDPSGVQWADFTVHQTDKAFVLVVAATYGAGSYELEMLGHNYNPVQFSSSLSAQAIEPLNPAQDLRSEASEGSAAPSNAPTEAPDESKIGVETKAGQSSLRDPSSDSL